MSSTTFPAHPFTSADLPRYGINRHQLREGLRRQEVRRVLRGVYASQDLPDSMELRIEATTRVVGPGVVIRDRTAAWLHGVDVRAFCEHEVLPPVETCALRGSAPPRRGDVDARTRDLRPGDLMEMRGLWVTTPLRTALDLGCGLPRRQALSTLDAFRARHEITRLDLLSVLPRYARRRGVVQLREVVALADPRAESPPESWMRLEVLDHGLPPPELQWWVEDNGVLVFRLDLAWPRHRVALEYDGREFHTSAEHKAYDADRRAWLRARGWTVIVLTAESWSADAVEDWVAEVRAALRDARPRRSRVVGSRRSR